MRNAMKTLLIGTALASFLISSGEAMIFPDSESLNAARTTSVGARYSLIFSAREEVTRSIESRNLGVKYLNTLIFQDPATGKRVGMSCAHFKENKHEDNHVILVRNRKTAPPQGVNENEALDLVMASIIDTLLYTPLTIDPHYRNINPAYNPEEEFHQKSKHDLFLFTTNDKFIKTFPLQIYNSDLEEGKEYHAVIGSFTPSFDNQLSNYDPSSYTESELLLHYKDGFFYRTLETMDFAFRFTKEDDGTLGWKCFPLSSQGTFASNQGDSGAVALTEDNKALGINVGVDYEEFYKDNQELASLLNNLKSGPDVQYLAENIEQLVDHIERHVSTESPSRKLVLEDDTVMYGFTLNQSFSHIRWSEYYMPLAPHREFIEEFIQTTGLREGEMS